MKDYSEENFDFIVEKKYRSLGLIV